MNEELRNTILAVPSTRVVSLKPPAMNVLTQLKKLAVPSTRVVSLKHGTAKESDLYQMHLQYPQLGSYL